MYKVADILVLHMPAQICERERSADKILRHHPEQFSPLDQAPYFQIDTVMATIPHLMGIEDQVIQTSLDLGPMLIFPKRIKVLNWSELRRFQHGTKGQWFYGIEGEWVGAEGPLSVKNILDGINCNGGITAADKQAIISAVRDHLDLRIHYE